jgi:hypothetical protein
LLLQLSKNIWFSCSSSLLKTFGARKPNVFKKLEEQENQMFLESWRSKKNKCFSSFLKTFGFLAPPAF